MASLLGLRKTRGHALTGAEVRVKGRMTRWKDSILVEPGKQHSKAAARKAMCVCVVDEHERTAHKIDRN